MDDEKRFSPIGENWSEYRKAHYKAEEIAENDLIVQLAGKVQDKKYRDFQSSLCPTVEPDRIIGVRTPALRSFAKELIKSGEVADFMENLPHYPFWRRDLHAALLR